jgi:hypothetical protein
VREPADGGPRYGADLAVKRRVGPEPATGRQGKRTACRRGLSGWWGLIFPAGALCGPAGAFQGKAKHLKPARAVAPAKTRRRLAVREAANKIRRGLGALPQLSALASWRGIARVGTASAALPSARSRRQPERPRSCALVAIRLPDSAVRSRSYRKLLILLVGAGGLEPSTR